MGGWAKRFGMAVLAMTCASACAPEKAARFPLREVLWQDPDRQPFAGPPEKFVSSAVYDVAHQTVLRPAAQGQIGMSFRVWSAATPLPSGFASNASLRSEKFSD